MQVNIISEFYELPEVVFVYILLNLVFTVDLLEM